MKNRSKNLLILGTASILIAIATTTVSLIVYHNSGDIYLDRSRPGFLPQEDEIKIPTTDEYQYKFSENQGEITTEEIEEYLIQLKDTKDKLNAIPDPYSPTSISDENLGIPAE